MQKTRATTAVSVQPKQSQAMCKNMTKLCLSSILSGRRLLDPVCFKKKPFANGMMADQLDCLNKTNPDSLADDKEGDNAEEAKSIKDGALLQRWLENGVFDAIDQRYLKSLSFIVAKEETNTNGEEPNVIESYTFKYEYSDEGECLIALGEGEDHNKAPITCTKEEMIGQAVQLLTHLTLLGDSLGPAPEKRNLLLKLKYHVNTPDDYEPEYFRSSSASAYSKYVSKTKKIEFSGLNSPHNTLTLTFTAADWLFNDDSESEEEFEEEEQQEEQKNDSVPSPLSEHGDGLMNNKVNFHNQDDVEDIMTQPQKEKNMKPPSSTPLRSTKKSCKQDDEDLEVKFSNLGTSFGLKTKLMSVEKSNKEDDDVTRLDDDSDDDDEARTRLDDDDEARTRLDDDDEIESDGEEANLIQLADAKQEQESAILNYLRGKKSASVSIIAIVCKVEELTVSAILTQLLKKGRVEKVGTRWCEISTPPPVQEEDKDIGNSMDESIDSFSQSQSQYESLSQSQSQYSQMQKQHQRFEQKDSEKLKKKNNPQTPSLPIAPIVANTRGRLPLASKHRPSSKSRSGSSMMSPPPRGSRKQTSKRDTWAGQLDEPEDDEIGGYSQDSLSQCSQSQGGSKYSVIAHPLSQNRTAKKPRRSKENTRFNY